MFSKAGPDTSEASVSSGTRLAQAGQPENTALEQNCQKDTGLALFLQDRAETLVLDARKADEGLLLSTVTLC